MPGLGKEHRKEMLENQRQMLATFAILPEAKLGCFPTLCFRESVSIYQAPTEKQKRTLEDQDLQKEIKVTFKWIKSLLCGTGKLFLKLDKQIRIIRQ